MPLAFGHVGQPQGQFGHVVYSRHTRTVTADLDYRLTVLADGCLDADPEVHRVLTDKVYPRQADVLRIAEWTQSLASPAAG